MLCSSIGKNPLVPQISIYLNIYLSDTRLVLFSKNYYFVKSKCNVNIEWRDKLLHLNLVKKRRNINKKLSDVYSVSWKNEKINMASLSDVGTVEKYKVKRRILSEGQGDASHSGVYDILWRESQFRDIHRGGGGVKQVN